MAFPEPEKPTLAYQNYLLSQQDPNFAAHLKDRKPDNSVHIYNAKEGNKQEWDFYDRAYTDAEGAQDTLYQLDQLSAIPIDTGNFTEARTKVAAMADGLGIPLSQEALQGITDAQSFNSVRYDMLRKLLEQQAGPQTDGDADRMLRTLPSLENKEEANQYIIRAMKALADRKNEKASFANQYLEKNGDNPTGLRRSWSSHRQNIPIQKRGPNGRIWFWHEFRDQWRAKGVDDSEIIEKWRKVNG